MQIHRDIYLSSTVTNGLKNDKGCFVIKLKRESWLSGVLELGLMA